jgi:hypothetical protein
VDRGYSVPTQHSRWSQLVSSNVSIVMWLSHPQQQQQLFITIIKYIHVNQIVLTSSKRSSFCEFNIAWKQLMCSHLTGTKFDYCEFFF